MAASSLETRYEEMEAENGDIDQTQSPPDEDVAQPDGEEKQSNSRLAQLPHTRVRNMMKLDSDLHIASQDSVFLVTKAAVSYIEICFYCIIDICNLLIPLFKKFATEKCVG